MKSVLFLYNAKAGKRKAERNADVACQVLQDHGYSVDRVELNFSVNPFEELKKQYDLVVIFGGDGTINYVVNCMKTSNLDLEIGIIPSGTANDFAGTLGMSFRPKKAARQIIEGELRHIDCGRVNDIYFVNILSFGVLTTTSQRTADEDKHKFGKLAYVIEGVKEFIAPHAVPLEVVADGERFDFNSMMVLVFNGKSAGGVRIARKSDLQDGMLEFLLMEKRNVVTATWAAWHHLFGGKSRVIKRLRVKHIEISSPVYEPTDVDGQKGADFPLSIDCLQGALRIICPRD